MAPLVKICGLKRPVDIEALDGVVEYLGFILEPTSPRAVHPTQLKQLRPLVTKSTPVLVTATTPPKEAIDTAAETEIPVVQHHGHLAPADYDYAASRGVRLAPVATYRPGTELRQVVQRLLQTPHEYILVDADKKTPATYEAGLKIPLAQLRQVVDMGKVAVAGGINPQNAPLVAQLKPYMVDVASGVERQPGEKDLQLVQQLLEALGRPHRHGPHGK